MYETQHLRCRSPHLAFLWLWNMHAVPTARHTTGAVPPAFSGAVGVGNQYDIFGLNAIPKVAVLGIGAYSTFQAQTLIDSRTANPRGQSLFYIGIIISAEIKVLLVSWFRKCCQRYRCRIPPPTPHPPPHTLFFFSFGVFFVFRIYCGKVYVIDHALLQVCEVHSK